MGAVLFFLKLIGMLLLIALGILLTLILLVLFVPVHYRLSGSYTDETPDGTVRFTWLLHLVTAEVTYYHGVAVSGTLRILGIPVRRLEGELR